MASSLAVVLEVSRGLPTASVYPETTELLQRGLGPSIVSMVCAVVHVLQVHAARFSNHVPRVGGWAGDPSTQSPPVFQLRVRFLCFQAPAPSWPMMPLRGCRREGKCPSLVLQSF